MLLGNSKSSLVSLTFKYKLPTKGSMFGASVCAAFFVACPSAASAATIVSSSYIEDKNFFNWVFVVTDITFGPTITGATPVSTNPSNNPLVRTPFYWSQSFSSDSFRFTLNARHEQKAHIGDALKGAPFSTGELPHAPLVDTNGDFEVVFGSGSEFSQRIHIHDPDPDHIDDYNLNYARTGSSITFDFTGRHLGQGDIVPDVPEPATWAMMLLGFGFVGGAMRSAKRRQKLAICSS